MGRRAEDQGPQWSFRKPVPTQRGAPGSLSQSVTGRAWPHVKCWVDVDGIAAGSSQSADHSPPSRFSPEGKQGTPLAPHSPGVPLPLEHYALVLQAPSYLVQLIFPRPTHFYPSHCASIHGASDKPSLSPCCGFQDRLEHWPPHLPRWILQAVQISVQVSASFPGPSALKQPPPTLRSAQQLVSVWHSPPHCLRFGCFFSFLFMCGRLQCHVYWTRGLAFSEVLTTLFLEQDLAHRRHTTHTCEGKAWKGWGH